MDNVESGALSTIFILKGSQRGWSPPVTRGGLRRPCLHPGLGIAVSRIHLPPGYDANARGWTDEGLDEGSAIDLFLVIKTLLKISILHVADYCRDFWGSKSSF